MIELHLSKIKDICLNVIVGTPQNLQYLMEKDQVNFWEPVLLNGLKNCTPSTTRDAITILEGEMRGYYKNAHRGDYGPISLMLK